MKGSSTTAESKEWAAPKLPIAPHLLLFFLYNLLYFMPLYLVYLWGYSEGGSSEVVGMPPRLMREIIVIYLSGFCSFAIGSQTPAAISWLMGRRKSRRWRPSSFQLAMPEKIAIGVLVVLFIATKIALIPLGVYREYAFSTGEMTGGPWTLSMFCSEMLLLVAIMVLFSNAKHHLLGFFFLSFVNAANLLHGTRIFFMITVMIGILYAYIRGYLPIRRVLLFGPPAFLGVLSLAYLIYLARSSAFAQAGTLSAAKLVSPIVYESIFSQLSLMSVVSNPAIWSGGVHWFHYFVDVFVFTIPRFIIPNKDELLWVTQFDYLSPKGAMNGYAEGMLYFGASFPVFYFFVGLIAGWLYRKAQKNGWWFALYAYFTADTLFHFMRDGYAIPSKMAINAMQAVILLIAWRYIFKLFLAKPQRSIQLSEPSGLSASL